MAFAIPPQFAAWRHRDARDGFEVVFLHADDDGYRLDGHTAASRTASHGPLGTASR